MPAPIAPPVVSRYAPPDPPAAPPIFAALLCAAPAAWLVMMVTGPVLVALMDTSAGPGATWDEFLVAFVIGMSLPLALVIAAVYLPVVVAMRRASLPGEPVALFALAGLFSGPLAGLLLLGGVHLLFAPAERLFVDDLRRLLQPDMRAGFGLLLALMLGGATFGGSFALATRYRERPTLPLRP